MITSRRMKWVVLVAQIERKECIQVIDGKETVRKARS
jgi:hypothetical protein